MDWIQSLIRLGLSLVLSFPIGWNREQTHKTAGLRTHLLVSLGSCLFTLIGLDMAKVFGGEPGRVAAQVVTGIGFLGGGAILRERFTIRGITTAASIWSTAAVGMACGAGFYPGAIVGAVATFLVLTIVERWEAKGRGSGKESIMLRIRVQGKDGLVRVLEALSTSGFSAERVRTETDPDGGATVVTVEGGVAPHVVSRLVTRFLADPDVTGVESKAR